MKRITAVIIFALLWHFAESHSFLYDRGEYERVKRDAHDAHTAGALHDTADDTVASANTTDDFCDDCDSSNSVDPSDLDIDYKHDEDSEGAFDDLAFHDMDKRSPSGHRRKGGQESTDDVGTEDKPAHDEQMPDEESDGEVQLSDDESSTAEVDFDLNKRSADGVDRKTEDENAEEENDDEEVFDDVDENSVKEAKSRAKRYSQLAGAVVTLREKRVSRAGSSHKKNRLNERRGNLNREGDDSQGTDFKPGNAIEK